MVFTFPTALSAVSYKALSWRTSFRHYIEVLRLMARTKDQLGFPAEAADLLKRSIVTTNARELRLEVAMHRLHAGDFASALEFATAVCRYDRRIGYNHLLYGKGVDALVAIAEIELRIQKPHKALKHTLSALERVSSESLLSSLLFVNAARAAQQLGDMWQVREFLGEGKTSLDSIEKPPIELQEQISQSLAAFDEDANIGVSAEKKDPHLSARL